MRACSTWIRYPWSACIQQPSQLEEPHPDYVGACQDKELSVLSCHVQAMDKLMPGFDGEIAKMAQRVLVNPRRIDWHTGVLATKVTPGRHIKGAGASNSGAIIPDCLRRALTTYPLQSSAQRFQQLSAPLSRPVVDCILEAVLTWKEFRHVPVHLTAWRGTLQQVILDFHHHSADWD